MPKGITQLQKIGNMKNLKKIYSLFTLDMYKMIRPASIHMILKTNPPVLPNTSKNANGLNDSPIIERSTDNTPNRNKTYPKTAQVLLFIKIDLQVNDFIVCCRRCFHDGFAHSRVRMHGFYYLVSCSL